MRPDAITQCVRAIRGLTATQRRMLTLGLRGAALPLPQDLAPPDTEKDRQRAIASVRTHARSLGRILAALDPDAREYVADRIAGGQDGDSWLVKNGRAATAYQTLNSFVGLLQRLDKISKPAPSIFKVRRELLIACDVANLLDTFGLPVTASDTGTAAECFRAVAECAGITVADSARYWIARAQENETWRDITRQKFARKTARH